MEFKYLLYALSLCSFYNTDCMHNYRFNYYCRHHYYYHHPHHYHDPHHHHDHRFCMMQRKYQNAFDEVFLTQYAAVHRLETNKLRNVAKFFAHLLGTIYVFVCVYICIYMSIG
jgi:hypothetical protein